MVELLTAAFSKMGFYHSPIETCFFGDSFAVNSDFLAGDIHPATVFNGVKVTGQPKTKSKPRAKDRPQVPKGKEKPVGISPQHCHRSGNCFSVTTGKCVRCPMYETPACVKGRALEWVTGKHFFNDTQIDCLNTYPCKPGSCFAVGGRNKGCTPCPIGLDLKDRCFSRTIVHIKIPETEVDIRKFVPNQVPCADFGIKWKAKTSVNARSLNS